MLTLAHTRAHLDAHTPPLPHTRFCTPDSRPPGALIELPRPLLPQRPRPATPPAQTAPHVPRHSQRTPRGRPCSSIIPCPAVAALATSAGPHCRVPAASPSPLREAVCSRSFLVVICPPPVPGQSLASPAVFPSASPPPFTAPTSPRPCAASHILRITASTAAASCAPATRTQGAARVPRYPSALGLSQADGDVLHYPRLRLTELISLGLKGIAHTTRPALPGAPRRAPSQCGSKPGRWCSWDRVKGAVSTELESSPPGLEVSQGEKRWRAAQTAPCRGRSAIVHSA